MDVTTIVAIRAFQDNYIWCLRQDSAAPPQTGGQCLHGLAEGRRGRIDGWPRPERAVDDLNHRGRILRRRDRNHKIRNRDAH